MILYEDNHLIAVGKAVGELVQPSPERAEALECSVKALIKAHDAKQGNVFLGVAHRLDQPVSGVVLFAKTSKALSRLNELFRARKMQKIYHAIVQNRPPHEAATLTHHLLRNSSINKSFAYDTPRHDTKEASLSYKIIGSSRSYTLLEVELHTGRHHQIRCQLSKIGCPIKGDLKYGAPRSNPNGGISLHARNLRFEHPVTHASIEIVAPYPSGDVWDCFG
jgi:23S rRNA pseudouridine1911/1915/1917 synthase